MTASFWTASPSRSSLESECLCVLWLTTLLFCDNDQSHEWPLCARELPHLRSCSMQCRVHYFRIHPYYWEDRLMRIKSLGMNAIQVASPHRPPKLQSLPGSNGSVKSLPLHVPTTEGALGQSLVRFPSPDLADADISRLKENCFG